MWHKNILEAIGNTPMVQLNHITRDIEATVLAKVETFNPGNSIKDRMALKMIEDAEKSGLLKPGGTIIEGTSGNTGMGLAIAAILKGYKCIFTTTDKQSPEKADALRAFGAEVIVCPTNVDPEDPRSYYSVSSRLVSEVPNSWKPNQYDNLSNRQAHYESTGPEIWEQTEGTITHLVAGVGTGGTITGIGMNLKEQNPHVQILGVDTYGSVYKKYKETNIFDKNEIYPYVTEGIGEDFLPQNVDFSIIDYFEKVTDKDAAIMTRRIVKEEGIWVGNSSGAALQGLMQMSNRFKKGDVVVVIFVDHGTRYLGKMFNDDWMLKMGYIDKSGLAACDLINTTNKNELISIEARETVNAAAQLMTTHDYSQVPVTDQGRIVGTLHEKKIFDHLLSSPDKLNIPVKDIMDEALPFVDINTSCRSLSDMLSGQLPAVLVRDFKTDKNFIITRSDLIRLML
ncbi:MAG: pyridoxal-phosphate dependent enzyme [Flavobacteriales bacterium]|nr:pyridoxal-phosphate dependent enzyme [Flavobacteriales bacterium]